MFKVAKKHLFNSQESNEEQAKKLTRLRLDRLEISNLEEGLDLFGSSVSHFFLQHVSYLLYITTCILEQINSSS